MIKAKEGFQAWLVSNIKCTGRTLAPGEDANTPASLALIITTVA